MLRVRDLSVRFQTSGPETAALSGVSFDLELGGSLALLGESGSGKSTVLLSLPGLLPRSAKMTGSVTVCGEAQLSRARGTRIAMVFSDALPALNPVMRIGAQIAEVAPQGEVDSVLRSVGLDAAVARAFPHQLSGGMRQRALIGMALATGAPFLAADEPTSALDSVTQAGIVRLLSDLRRERGLGLLLATHDLSLARRLCDRVAVMHCGRIVEQGPADEVLSRPSHPRTQALVRNAPPPFDDAARAPARAGPEVLRVEGLAADRGGRRVLRSVSFSLAAGETLGIVGESGSGKTTLARALLRLVEPAAGQVLWKGQPLSAMRPRELRKLRRELQIVFQDAASSLDPRMTVRAALEEPLRAHALQRPIDDLIAAVELDREVLRRYPHELSSGQAQRVALARALATRPSLLVADEAFSALDVSLQTQLGALLRRLQSESGAACLFITHDLRLAAQVCHRIAVLSQGSLVPLSAAHPAGRALLDAARG